jgi:AcrR family transcriptional regulator
MLDPDQLRKSNPLLPFAPADLDRYQLRMNRADFARLVGVSKQTVGDWTRKGWVVLGADGLLDPKDAMRRLLRHIDPARLRAKTMAPLIVEAGAQARKIAELEKTLADTREAVEFHEEVAAELLAQLQALIHHLGEEWEALQDIPPSVALAAILEWHEAALDRGPDPGPILTFAPQWHEVTLDVGSDPGPVLPFAPPPAESPLGEPLAQEGGGESQAPADAEAEDGNGQGRLR